MRWWANADPDYCHPPHHTHTAPQRSTDRQRLGQDQRAMVLARWGGLGGHRYQVGFSGDVKDVNWQTLGDQPYFTATAANVAFSHWSHDIVG